MCLMRSDLANIKAARTAQLQQSLVGKGEQKTIADYCRAGQLFDKPGRPNPAVFALFKDKTKAKLFLEACDADDDLRRLATRQGLDLEEVSDYVRS
jgi:hypothetical protein